MAAIMEIQGNDQDALLKLAAGGEIDYSTWPLLLTNIVSRIDKAAHNDFPIPRIPQPSVTTHPPPAPEPRFLAPLPPSDDDSADPGPSTENDAANTSPAASSQETNKENAAPPKPSTPEPAPVLEPGAMPPQITAMLAEITGVLNETFHTYPPHTIQRLAELVLEPRRHYKSLPSYLHAVDRVVHVTSGNNIYPLPPAIPDMSHMTLNGVTDNQSQENNGGEGEAVWATASGSSGAAIGSDEALGGALLTPIPWLARRTTNGDAGSESGESSTLGSEGGPSPLAASQGPVASPQRQTQGRQYEMQVRTESTETIEGPNGMGSIETVTVSVNGLSSLTPAQQQRVITQGELIRQEQRAGVVPISQLARTGPVIVSSSPVSTEPVTTPTNSNPGDTSVGEAEGEAEGTKDTDSEKSDEEMADEDQVPHARGPDIIGAADMGPQTPSSSTFSISSAGNIEMRGIDVEAAVGRRQEAPSTESNATEESESNENGAVIKPTSSESDATATVGQGEATSGKDGEGKDKEGNPKETPSENTAAGVSSATIITAHSSPAHGKREAEDDIADNESVSSKRLKGSPEKDESEIASSSTVEPGKDAKSEPQSKEEEEEELKKDGEGDIVLPDETDGAPPAVEPVSSTNDTGTATASTDDGENKEGKEVGAKSTAEPTG